MNALTTPDHACKLCGSTEVTTIAHRSRSGRPMRSVACTGCGLVWADPRPHEVRQFYEEDYRLAYKNTFQPRAKHVLRAGRVALDRLERIRAVLRPSSRVLDVGSGGGEFAYLLRTLGHEVTGVEPNRGYAGFSREQYGLDVRVGFIDEVELPAASFDLITIWHVLEHTADPYAVLRQLRAALRPGGRLVVEVPNIEATCQSPRSSFHEAHLYTFGEPTLGRLGARAGLAAVSSTLSEDGGNITMIFEPVAASAAAPVPEAASLRIPGNHARVEKIVAGHTFWSHALSLHPWRRAAERMGRMLSEVGASLRGNGRPLLDALYAEPTPMRLTPQAWLVGAYGFAIATEEVLLDRLLPAARFSSGESLAIYLGLQVVVIGALFWTFGRRLRSGRQLMKAGVWTVPLLAVPAVC